MQILFVQHGSGSSNANTVNINQVFIQWQLYPLKTFVDKIFFCVHQKECLVRLWDPYLRFPRIFRICARIRKHSSHTIFVGKIMIISRDFKTPKHFFKKVFIIGQILSPLESDERISITASHYLYVVWFMSCKKY